MYGIVQSLCCTPGTNIALYVNYTSIKKYNPSRLNQKEIKYLNRAITRKEIESIIFLNVPMKKSSGLDELTSEFFFFYFSLVNFTK